MQDRLDRGFANPSWRLKYPNATITHLHSIRSDHRPLLFQLKFAQITPSKPFRFESMWVLHLEIGFVIQKAWNRSQYFLYRIKNTKLDLKAWNKNSFGRVQEIIKTSKNNI